MGNFVELPPPRNNEERDRQIEFYENFSPAGINVVVYVLAILAVVFIINYLI